METTYYLLPCRRGILRFGGLCRCLLEVSERMLVSQTVKRVRATYKVIQRKVYRIVPPRMDYSLTEACKTLIPIMNLLRDRGDEYDTTVYLRTGREKHR